MKPLRLAAALALGIAPFVARTAVAQVALPTPGARVRVTAPDFDISAHTGRLIRATPDSLTINFARDRLEMTIPVDKVSRLEVSTGKGRAEGLILGAGSGTVIGLLSGIGVGAFMYAFNCETGELCSLWFLVTVPAGAGVGFIAGSIIGAARPPDRWEEVPLPGRGRELGMSDGHGRLGVGLRIAF